MSAARHHKADPHRNAELAKIHIAWKDLSLQEDTYRQIIRDIGKAPSGSSADLSPEDRHRALKHFENLGWEPLRKTRKRKPKVSRNNEILASAEQVTLIRHIWCCMAQAGAVKAGDEAGLRAWVRASSRRYHPQRAGYSAPNFLPQWVAIKITEQLKKWARRCEVKWR